MAETWTDRERQEELDHAVSVKVQAGCRVESRTDFQAVLVRGRPVNHLLHFIVGIFTVGVWWLVVWLPIVASGSGETRLVLSIDETGAIREVTSRDKVPPRPAVEVRGPDGELH
jgi:hypothetical protein